jgi:hypothetical protein
MTEKEAWEKLGQALNDYSGALDDLAVDLIKAQKEERRRRDPDVLRRFREAHDAYYAAIIAFGKTKPSRRKKPKAEPQ